VASYSWQMTHRLSSGMPLPPVERHVQFLVAHNTSRMAVRWPTGQQSAQCSYSACLRSAGRAEARSWAALWAAQAHRPPLDIILAHPETPVLQQHAVHCGDHTVPLTMSCRQQLIHTTSAWHVALARPVKHLALAMLRGGLPCMLGAGAAVSSSCPRRRGVFLRLYACISLPVDRRATYAKMAGKQSLCAGSGHSGERALCCAGAAAHLQPSGERLVLRQAGAPLVAQLRLRRLLQPQRRRLLQWHHHLVRR
jgi:hypothetical protein